MNIIVMVCESCWILSLEHIEDLWRCSWLMAGKWIFVVVAAVVDAVVAIVDKKAEILALAIVAEPKLEIYANMVDGDVETGAPMQLMQHLLI